MEPDYSFYISVGTLYLLQELTDVEGNEDRKQKKQLVLAQKRAEFHQWFEELTNQLSQEHDVGQLLPREWPKDKATIFVIDLMYCDPFAPFELKFKDDDLEQAIKKLALLIGLTAEDVVRIQDTYQQAHRSHWRLRWKVLAFLSIFGTLFLVTGRGIQFIIRQSIQGARGAFQALSPAYGLTALGGRNLAIFGPQMAGGMWLLTENKESTDNSTSGWRVPSLLGLLRSSDIKQELIKLQVTFKEVVLEDRPDEAQAIIDSLYEQQRKLEARIEKEKSQNEKRATRIQEVENTRFHLERSINWMESSLAEKVDQVDLR